MARGFILFASGPLALALFGLGVFKLRGVRLTSLAGIKQSAGRSLGGLGIGLSLVYPFD